MDDSNVSSEREALQRIIDALSGLDKGNREKIIRTIITFFELEIPSIERISPPSPTSTSPNQSSTAHQREPKFGGHAVLSPKEFLLEKSPQTETDRAVCLAYYLAHYLDTPHFRTVDITKLNTEAAQRKFANTAYVINSATQRGFLAPAPKSSKQLSAMGERYVEALPDRETARELVEKFRPRYSRRRKKEDESGEGQQ